MSTSPIKYFKILVDGNSCHGGSFTWNLPKTSDSESGATVQPGNWHELPDNEEPVLCEKGFHLTSDPKKWWKDDGVVYLAEYAGKVDGPEGFEDKIAVQKVRLLREVTEVELAELNIFRSGTHSIDDGLCFAVGSAKVEARGSAQVEARGSAQVTARGSAKVTARDSAQVEARGSAKVEARDSAQVEAWGSVQVTARDSAKVEARDSAQVEARDSAKVEARDSAKVTARDSAKVEARDSAQVEAWGSAKVTAWGSAQVEAWGSAQVEARGSAQVTARDSAKVTARDSAQVEARGSALTTIEKPSCSCGLCKTTATVQASDSAIVIDRRDGVSISVGGKTWQPA